EDARIHWPLLRNLHRRLGLRSHHVQHRYIHDSLLCARSSFPRLHTELLRGFIVGNPVFVLVDKMKALVVVSELNSARTLKHCLDSLVEQDTKDDYHIMLIDGGSNDGSLEIARSFFPKILLLVSMHISEVGGQNLGCSFALDRYDVILFTNSDCYVGRDWVNRHLAWHKLGYDMVGGKLFWGG